MNDQRAYSVISAHSLKIFGECERLYEYTYINPRPWPAPAHPDPARAEQAEAAGRRFHKLVHMHARGLDPAVLASTEAKLQRWYARYLTSNLSKLVEGVYSEQVLILTIGNRKLFVKYDRLLKKGDRWLIIDWKTSSLIPEAAHLAGDWQARLYPFALVEAGTCLNGGKPIRPADVEMCFYYVEHDIERRFSYGEYKHQENHQILEQVIARVAAADKSTFQATGKVTGRCIKPPCRFYSLCHMSALPISAWQVVDEPEGDSFEEQLELWPEFEFEDEPVVL